MPVGTVEDVRDGDVVILAVKSQDTVAALDSLAGRDVTIVCAQNGVANEVEALRRFERVYGVFVWLPAQHVRPRRGPGLLARRCTACWPSGASRRARTRPPRRWRAAFTEAGCDGAGLART